MLSLGFVVSCLCTDCLTLLFLLLTILTFCFYFVFFFFNDTATTEIYTLSLHDALPILSGGFGGDLNFELIEKFPWGTPFAEFLKF